MIHLDPDACIFGWGPCPDTYGFAHSCTKRQGHGGFHICEFCGHRKRTDRLLDALASQIEESE